MISHKYKFVFTFLPKTGTTSIVNLFRSDSQQRFADCHLTQSTQKHYDKLGDDELNYLKISSCRNPFPRVVSLWKFWNKNLRKKKIPTTGFSYFVENYTKMQKKICSVFNKYEKIHFCSCVDGVALSTNNSLSHTDIDIWVRTENLQEDLDIICDKIGIPRQKLPHKNKSKHKHYTEYYNDETRQIVAEKYPKDIEYFGYEFGE